MLTIKIIILSLFFLLWVVPSVWWHFTATPEEKKKLKDDVKKQCYPTKPHKNYYSCFPLSLWNQN
jgi:hypothetical protein